MQTQRGFYSWQCSGTIKKYWLADKRLSAMRLPTGGIAVQMNNLLKSRP